MYAACRTKKVDLILWQRLLGSALKSSFVIVEILVWRAFLLKISRTNVQMGPNVWLNLSGAEQDLRVRRLPIDPERFDRLLWTTCITSMWAFIVDIFGPSGALASEKSTSCENKCKT